MKVSVALCTYNGAPYIEKQLESILNQTRLPDEIVLSDDGSGDDTVLRARKLLSAGEIPFRILENPVSLGVAENFRNAVSYCCGDYIFTCDQDDLWFPDKVEAFLNAFEKTGAALLFSDGILIDGEGNDLKSRLWEVYRIDPESIEKKGIFEEILRRPIVTGAAMAFSRSLAQRWDRVPAPFLHDEWLSVLAAAADEACFLSRPTFFYRQHRNNVVGAGKRSFFGRLKNWLGDAAGLKEFHAKRFLRAKEILAAAEKSGYEEKAAACVSFWKTVTELDEQKGLRSVFRALRLYRLGGYGSFYAGLHSFLRHGAVLLFGKNR